MSNHFKIVDDASVVLREKGFYKQAAVFSLGDRLFAEYAKGKYISLLANDGTSAPNVTWSNLDTPFSVKNKDGRIVEVIKP